MESREHPPDHRGPDVAGQITRMLFRKVPTKEAIHVDASVCNCLITSAQR